VLCVVYVVSLTLEIRYVKYNNNWDWSDDKRNTPQVLLLLLLLLLLSAM
jgi:hypothetical protein